MWGGMRAPEARSKAIMSRGKLKAIPTIGAPPLRGRTMPSESSSVGRRMITAWVASLEL